MGNLTVLDRVVELEAAVRVLGEELCRLRVDVMPKIGRPKLKGKRVMTDKQREAYNRRHREYMERRKRDKAAKSE